MIRLCCRSKIIWIIKALFMKINMHLRKPVVVLTHSALRFLLRLPCPIPIEIEIIVIGSPTRPHFIMLATLPVCIKRVTSYRGVPIYISIPTVWVKTWINNDHHILQPFFCSCIRRIYQRIQRFHGCFAG